MSVSVIVVSHNSIATIGRCLQSLIDQLAISVDETGETEIVVVDNASSDGSDRLIDEQFPQVCLIRREQNRGFGHGNNVGAKKAVGTYLVFLNPDAVVTAGWMEPLLAPLQERKDVGMTTAKIVLMDHPQTVNACGNDMHISGLTLCRGMGRPVADYRDSAEVSAISGAAFAMRRSVFAQLGGFDESLFLYMEDADLSLRARLAGYHILFVPESVILHHYRLRFGDNKIFYQERNRYIMLLKSYRWLTLLVLIPTFLLAEIVSWGFILSRERNQIGGKVRAYLWPMLHLPHILQIRKQTQQLRQVGDHTLLNATIGTLTYAQAGDGLATTTAQRVFDPLFKLLRRFSLAVVRN